MFDTTVIVSNLDVIRLSNAMMEATNEIVSRTRARIQHALPISFHVRMENALIPIAFVMD